MKHAAPLASSDCLMWEGKRSEFFCVKCFHLSCHFGVVGED